MSTKYMAISIYPSLSLTHMSILQKRGEGKAATTLASASSRLPEWALEPPTRSHHMRAKHFCARRDRAGRGEAVRGEAVRQGTRRQGTRP